MDRRRLPVSKDEPSVLHSKLRIDPDRLDEAVIEQPGLYHEVAMAAADALAQRDAAKLDLEECEAEVDRRLREEAAETEGRVTEGRMAQQIKLDPQVQQAQRVFLDAKRAVEMASALKEAFQQRSYMLRELVAIQLAELNNLSIERGARQGVGDLNHAKIAEMRRERRGSGIG